MVTKCTDELTICNQTLSGGGWGGRPCCQSNSSMFILSMLSGKMAVFPKCVERHTSIVTVWPWWLSGLNRLV